jgi:hypothetical protein
VGHGDRLVAAKGAAAIVGGVEPGLAELAAGGVPRAGSVQAPLIEGTSDGVRGSEQDGREPGALWPSAGLAGLEREHSDGIDDRGERLTFHPVGGGVQRGSEHFTAARLVPVPQDHHGQPDLQLSTHPAPPRRLPLLYPGQRLCATAGRSGQVAFVPVQFGADLGQPGSHVVEAHAAFSGSALGLLQVRASTLQIARPDPGGGEHPVDVGKVSPGAQLPAA